MPLAQFSGDFAMTKYKITGRQYRNDHCLVCGFDNPFSLDLEFWQLENGELAAYAETREEHQSYPGRTHGGMISALLDEVIGRAVCIEEPGCWGVTTELTVRYKKPVPLGEKLLIVGRITRNRSRMFEGAGEIYLAADGSLLAEATGNYLKLKAEQIVPCAEGENPVTKLNWQLRPLPDGAPEYIELPY